MLIMDTDDFKEKVLNALEEISEYMKSVGGKNKRLRNAKGRYGKIGKPSGSFEPK